MSGKDSCSHASVQVGGDYWQVRCCTYADTTPILTLSAGRSGLSVTTRSKDADEEAVKFARALAREAQRFAEEMERMHAARSADDENTKAAGSDAA